MLMTAITGVDLIAHWFCAPASQDLQVLGTNPMDPCSIVPFSRGVTFQRKTCSALVAPSKHLPIWHEVTKDNQQSRKTNGPTERMLAARIKCSKAEMLGTLQSPCLPVPSYFLLAPAALSACCRTSRQACWPHAVAPAGAATPPTSGTQLSKRWNGLTVLTRKVAGAPAGVTPPPVSDCNIAFGGGTCQRAKRGQNSLSRDG